MYKAEQSRHNQPHAHTHTRLTALCPGHHVSRYHRGKTNLDFTEARDSEWQRHPLDHMQLCTSLQTDNHASTPPLSSLQAGCHSCRQTNSVKALKATTNHMHWQTNTQSSVVSGSFADTFFNCYHRQTDRYLWCKKAWHTFTQHSKQTVTPARKWTPSNHWGTDFTHRHVTCNPRPRVLVLPAGDVHSAAYHTNCYNVCR